MELNHVIFAIIILILACLWWFLYHSTEADLAAARAAVKEVIKKQQIDVNSYNMRADLHVYKLVQTRQAHCESTDTSKTQQQLEATTTMVKSFLESITFFQKKWNEQNEQLVADYPIILNNPVETFFDQLLQVPNGVKNTQLIIKVALQFGQ